VTTFRTINLLCAVVICMSTWATPAFAQDKNDSNKSRQSTKSSPGSSGSILGMRKAETKKASDDKKPAVKPTPSPAKPAEAAKSGTASAQKPGTPPTTPGKAPANNKGKPGAAAKAGPSTTGQVKKVTRGLLDSVRPQRVTAYDEDEMRAMPGVIILNSRKYKSEKSLLERQSSAAIESSSDAAPASR
jgi:hypothetical protein